MASTRRFFLRNASLGMAGIGSAPLWLQRVLYAEDVSQRRKKVLVTVFQRGAADGLNIVVPHGEAQYYALRPSIAIPRPSTAGFATQDCTIDLDGYFGLHPSLAPLKRVWDQQKLAIVHASGSPDPTRSHFDAQDYMESGTPGLKATHDGWLNRALPVEQNISPVRAISMGPNLPRALQGQNGAIAVENLGTFQVRDSLAAQAFQSLYAGSRDSVLQGTGKETFEAVSLLQSLQKQPYQPAAGAVYPGTRFGGSMRQIAQLIKANVGLEIAFADLGGWDHHVNEVGQRASQGRLANLLGDFGQTLAAFYQDLGDRMEDVVVVTMSEFGRTARENGTRGTDHGHANCMFIMGGPVKGGKVYGKWPGLAEEQLHENRDLAITTDFRDVLGEMVVKHLENRSLSAVFPNYKGTSQQFRNLLVG